MPLYSDARPSADSSLLEGGRTMNNGLLAISPEQDHVGKGTLVSTPGLDAPSLEKMQSLQPPLAPVTTPARSWNPVTLRPWFAVSLISLMIAVAIALEIAVHFSRVDTGWSVPSAFSATSGILHYIYTLPPVAVAMIIVALWAWTDVDIKRMQPYIDLAYGNAPASRSLLLDYSSKHPAIVSYFAFQRNHWIVGLSSLMVLTGLALQPLTASLFTIKNIWWDGPDLVISMLEELGQIGDLSNLNMSTFITSAGFVQANVLFNATPPNFIDGVWTIARVTVPRDTINNGTMFPITSSYRSTANCQAADSINLDLGPDGSTQLSATSSDCSFNLTLLSITSPPIQFGVIPATCANSESPTQPVTFYTLFSNSTNAQDVLRSVIFCRPKIEAFKTSGSVAIQTGQLLAAKIVEPLDVKGTMADADGPLKGKPLNGIAFDWMGNDTFTTTLVTTVRTGLANAILQNATSSPGGLVAQMRNGNIVSATEVSYSLYLSLLAKVLYFIPSDQPVITPTKTFLPRLFIVPQTSHILTGTLLALAILASIVHYFHLHTRDLVILPLRPGTLASAAAFTTRSNLTQLFEKSEGDAGVYEWDDQKLSELLSGKLYGIDKETGRVVVLKDAPAQALAPPDARVQRRGSLMAMLTRPKATTAV